MIKILLLYFLSRGIKRLKHQTMYVFFHLFELQIQIQVILKISAIYA
jgi:hypothetical protein